MDVPDSLKRYEIYRDYIQHENDLSDSRISRTLVLHGFLFASYSWILRGKINLAQSKNLKGDDLLVSNTAFISNKTINTDLSVLSNLSDIFLLLITITGMLTAIASLIGVKAAFDAIDKIKTDSREKIQDDINTLNLPAINGGGCDIAERNGHLSAYSLVTIIIFFWFIVFLLTMNYFIQLTIFISLAIYTTFLIIAAAFYILLPHHKKD